MRFTRACHKFKKVSRFFKFAKKEKKTRLTSVSYVDQRIAFFHNIKYFFKLNLNFMPSFFTFDTRIRIEIG